MLHHMRTLDDVFNSWGTLTELASEVGWGQDAVEKWRKRQSIPSAAWKPLIQAMRRKDIQLTTDQLLSMHERARRSA